MTGTGPQAPAAADEAPGRAGEIDVEPPIAERRAAGRHALLQPRVPDADERVRGPPAQKIAVARQLPVQPYFHGVSCTSREPQRASPGDLTTRQDDEPLPVPPRKGIADGRPRSIDAGSSRRRRSRARNAYPEILWPRCALSSSRKRRPRPSASSTPAARRTVVEPVTDGRGPGVGPGHTTCRPAAGRGELEVAVRRSRGRTDGTRRTFAERHGEAQVGHRVPRRKNSSRIRCAASNCSSMSRDPFTEPGRQVHGLRDVSTSGARFSGRTCRTPRRIGEQLGEIGERQLAAAAGR